MKKSTCIIVQLGSKVSKNNSENLQEANSKKKSKWSTNITNKRSYGVNDFFFRFSGLISRWNRRQKSLIVNNPCKKYILELKIDFSRQ